jgi:hypothetical protein
MTISRVFALQIGFGEPRVRWLFVAGLRRTAHASAGCQARKEKELSSVFMRAPVGHDESYHNAVAR